MKICDRCGKGETEVNVAVITYMVMVTQQYTPYRKDPEEDYRMQIELCDDCVHDVARAVGETVKDRTGRAFRDE